MYQIPTMIAVSKGGYGIRRWAFSHSRDERVIDGKCMCPSIPCMGSILKSVWPIGEDNHLFINLLYSTDASEITCNDTFGHASR